MVALCGGDYRVGHRSDRMGYRLEGARLAHRGGHDIVSDGIPPGAIQVPGDGQPIVLMADRQPTGGYPKIGTVIRADLPKLAQTPPGGLVRFRAVTRDQAVQALADALALCDIAMAIARGGMATGEVRLRRSRRAP
jgi:allophanate hydrolase subunit 2